MVLDCRFLNHEREKKEIVWESGTVHPFTELILSWNGFRPKIGKWLIFVRLHKQKQKSPWLPLAEWGTIQQQTFQRTFKSSPPDSFAETDKDAAMAKEGVCDGFSAKIAAVEGADLRNFDCFYASLFNASLPLSTETISLRAVFLKNVPLQSQMTLPHPRHKDLCSPTSTSTAVNFLLGGKKIDPLRFAQSIHDSEFDIYGNWILNTAEAYCCLEGAYWTWVERLSDFRSLHAELVRGNPVIVSIKGEIRGAPKPYPYGHLICITGYDPKEDRIYCVDPAFSSDAETSASYSLRDFCAAWGIRKNLSYRFEKRSFISS